MNSKNKNNFQIKAELHSHFFSMLTAVKNMNHDKQQKYRRFSFCKTIYCKFELKKTKDQVKAREKPSNQRLELD